MAATRYDSFRNIFIPAACSEHLIDWFHIMMRLTVLQQQAKGLQAEQPQFGQEISKELESVKHLLWR